MMIRPKMGFIVFGVHKDGLKDPLGVPFINQKIIDESKAAIEAKGVKLVENEIVVAYKQEAREALARLKHDDSVDGVILFSGTWVWASEIVAAVRDFERAGKGVIIWTVPGSQGWRLVGTLALGASFKEIGMKYRSVYGSDNDTVEKVACFSRACALRNKLNMTTIGAFGGRGMGLTCGCADPSQFMREFGVDIDSRDSMDILKAAEEVTEEEIQDVKENLIKPYFQEMPPDDGCTERSIRLYLAVKKIIETEKFDMYVIQSFPGLAEEYAASCFTQSMMLQQGIPTATLCDYNNVLTVFLLSNLTPDPVYYGDFQCIDKEKKVVKVIGDGACAPSLAGPDKARFAHHGLPTEGSAGGLSVEAVLKPGKVVMGRIGRDNGMFEMILHRGQVYTPDPDDLKDQRTESGMWFWPHAFIKMDVDYDYGVQVWDSEYITLAYGDEEIYGTLKEFCYLTDIKLIEM